MWIEFPCTGTGSWWIWWITLFAFLSSLKVPSKVFVLWFNIAICLALINGINSFKCTSNQSWFLLDCLLNRVSCDIGHFFFRFPHFPYVVSHKGNSEVASSRAPINCKVFWLSDILVVFMHGKWYVEQKIFFGFKWARLHKMPIAQ